MKRQTRTAVAVLTWLLLLTAACSSSFTFSGDPAVRDPSTPTPEDNPLPEGALIPNPDPSPGAEPTTPPIEAPPRVEDEEASARIAIQTSDGQLFTVQPDGSDRIDLTEVDERRFNRQPTWSPDASRIGWVSLDPRDGNAQVRTDRFDLTSPTTRAVGPAPFYLNWDPSSSQVAYLAPSPAGIDLGLVQITPDDATDGVDPVQRLDRGEPYFFAWGPDGDELLIHASGFRLDRINVDGSTRVIEEFPAPFQAPVWLGEDETLVYADQTDGENFLVTTGPLGEGRIELATFEGRLTFVVNDPGEYAALISRELPSGGDGGVITASTRLQPAPDDDDFFDPDDPFADPVDVVPTDMLSFIALYGGELTTVSGGKIVAFWWDPTGETLAWLEPSDDGGGMLQWWFSDRNQVWGGVSFTPSQTFATNYLPFFDQYAQSHSFFSPDGTELTFAGQLANGEQGIFVVGIERGAQANKIADGVFAVWSPDSAGGGASVL